jgi:hypothetical protein
MERFWIDINKDAASMPARGKRKRESAKHQVKRAAIVKWNRNSLKNWRSLSKGVQIQ